MRNRRLWLLFLVPVAVTVGLFLVSISPSLVGPGVGDKGPLGGALNLLLARPAFAQSTTTGAAFPDDEAGISAYIRFPAASTTHENLNRLVTSLFISMTYAGDNYVVGQFKEARASSTAVSGETNFVTVSLYADNQGWLIAYLPKDRLTSEILYSNASDAWKSVLAKALDRAAKVQSSSYVTHRRV